MKPIGQIFALCIESIQGFKYSSDYFNRFETNLRTKMTDEQKIEDRVRRERQKEAEALLFQDVKRLCENRIEGKQNITNWFGKK